MQHEPHLGIRVDRVDQERRCVEQRLAVGPITENRERERVGGPCVHWCAVCGVGVVDEERAAESGSNDEEFLHDRVLSEVERGLSYHTWLQISWRGEENRYETLIRREEDYPDTEVTAV